jgi:exodeoxyribonuclease VII small subunit
MATSPPQKKEPAQSFESSIERLETIVEAMESDKMPLEELLVRYEEGIKLVKICQEKLETAEKRIEIITRDAASKPQIQEFEPNAPAKSEEPDVSLF